MNMNTSAEPKTVLNREDIAAHAHQLWQHEGCQTGRDQEYWLKAEQQLRAALAQGNGGTTNVGATSNESSAKGKTTARPNAVPASSGRPASKKY